ncbi:MAG: transporter substrate-binding domain-containing protein [Treponema sp.]|jgi:putative glutamine transport system substrate-binding protein|nr:transporter substrate-binding domain-containing protein [Treponema sp.]
MKRFLTFFTFFTFFTIAAILFSSCDEPLSKSAQIRAIQKRGVFRVGISADMKKFSYLEAGSSEPEGFEIDLARLIAKDILGDEKAVRFVPVSPRVMFVLLDNGEIDSLIAGITISEERKKSSRFTSPYYVDGVGVMVKKDSGIDTMEALDGKRVGVVTMTTTRNAFEEEARRIGISLNYAEYGSHNELMAALLTGKVDAIGNDQSLLTSFVDSGTRILDHSFSPQPYGIAVKLSDDKLAAYLESLLDSMQADGTISELSARWGL